MGFERYLEKKFIAAGIFMGLSGLARPEYGLVIAVLLGDQLIQALAGEKRLKDFIQFVIPVAIAGFLFLGWDCFVDGRPFPATFYVKASFFHNLNLAESIRIAFKMITADAPLFGRIVWFGLLGIACLKGRERRAAVLFLFSAATYAVGQVAVIPRADPKAFYYIRYLLPVVPLFWIPLAAGIWAGVRFLWDHKENLRSVLGKTFGRRIYGDFPCLAGSLFDSWEC